jgi:hypothetical protein
MLQSIPSVSMVASASKPMKAPGSESAPAGLEDRFKPSMATVASSKLENHPAESPPNVASSAVTGEFTLAQSRKL